MEEVEQIKEVLEAVSSLGWTGVAIFAIWISKGIFTTVLFFIAFVLLIKVGAHIIKYGVDANSSISNLGRAVGMTPPLYRSELETLMKYVIKGNTAEKNK